MSWEKWFLVGLFVLGALTMVARIGKPKPVTTPSTAAIALCLFAGEIALVVFA